PPSPCFAPFFLHHPPPTRIYTLSLHDALPISGFTATFAAPPPNTGSPVISLDTDRTIGNLHFYGPNDGTVGTHNFTLNGPGILTDRKSTRLNSSHVKISYAVFCLKKKKENTRN